MTAARLTVALVAALALAPSAEARIDAPRVAAPEGLRAFLLRADEPKTDQYPRTPSFAWRPVPRTLRYEFQLSTSNTYRDNGIVYRDTTLKTPAISVPISLPWITGKPYALYARVRAVTQTGKTPWTASYGFNMRWPTLPEPMSSFPGLLRWTPIPGATAYQVWLVEPRKVITTLTNVADERELYSFHTDAKWTSSLHWRVRAVRGLYGTRANSLPTVSYGPWSQTYTSVNPPFAVGGLNVLATASDTITDATTDTDAHRLMPGFVYTGNRTMFDTTTPLYRVYAFTDSDCVNEVFVGSAQGAPAYAPRVSGPLDLPDSLSGIAAAANRFLGDLDGDGVEQLKSDGQEITPNEAAKPAAEGGGETPASGETPTEEGEGEKEGEGSAETGSQTESPIPLELEDGDKIPPVELWDTSWPEGGYYWTVVGVDAVEPEPFETTLAANAGVGSTTIVLDDAAGLAAGNKLEVGLSPPEVVTIQTVAGSTVTLTAALTGPHFAGEEVVRSADTIVYQDSELAQDVCAAGRVLRFGRMSEPAVTIAGAPLASGLSTNGRLISATRTQSLFYGSPVVAWNPASGAHGYEVQWSKKRNPFDAAAKPVYTYSTSAVLPLKPGTWYYRVRGINLILPLGAQSLSWSDPVKLVVAKPRFSIVK